MKKTTITLAACLAMGAAHAQEAEVLRKMSDNKFATYPGLPTCTTLAVQSGDPAKGPSILLIKAKSGCTIPWHWHTPNETVMMVSGAATLEMKEGGHSVKLGPGGYGMLPSKHVHRFVCRSSCIAFVSSDAIFDIHYVDANGAEITPEAALGKKK